MAEPQPRVSPQAAIAAQKSLACYRLSPPCRGRSSRTRLTLACVSV
jgi:hypothetical protein